MSCLILSSVACLMDAYNKLMFSQEGGSSASAGSSSNATQMKKRKKRKKKGDVDDEPPSLTGPTGIPVYKTVKFMLNKLMSPTHQVKVQEAVQVTHKVATLTMEFVKLYTLSKYHGQQPLPVLDEDFYKTAIRVITKSAEESGGRPFTRNDVLQATLVDFHEKVFLPISPRNARIEVVNMSHILSYLAQTLSTVQTTNITVNFPRYIRRYVNKYFQRLLYQQNGWA